MIRFFSCGAIVSLVLSAQAFGEDQLTSDAALDFHVQPTTDVPVLHLAMNVQAPPAEPMPKAVPVFGAADSWRYNFFVGGGFAIVNARDTVLAMAGAGVSYFIIDNFSIDFELLFAGFNQPGEDALGVGFNVLVRWHIIAHETWSFYIDGGAGILGTSANVPPGTLSFNFTPQAGVGVSFEVAEDTRLFIGARVHHVSNANLGDTNIGLDNILAYAGVSFPF